MKRTLYAIPILLATACADCECKVVNGYPNFSVRTSYSFVQNPHNLFLKDTLMTYYFVTVTEDGIAEEYTGQCDHSLKNENGDRSIVWSYGNTGEPVSIGGETHKALRLCLKMATWDEAKSQQRIDDIRSILEDDNSEQNRSR